MANLLVLVEKKTKDLYFFTDKNIPQSINATASSHIVQAKLLEGYSDLHDLQHL